MNSGGASLRLKVFLSAGVIFSGLFVVAMPSRAAGNVTGWFWSGTIGWISLSCENFGTCATSDYGVDIESVPGAIDPRRAKMTGYGWSSNVGWVCFGETCAAANPEGIANYAEWRDYVPGSFGASCNVDADCGVADMICVTKLGKKCSRPSEFYGWAQAVSLGSSGWIALNCHNDVSRTCATAMFHVAYDRGWFTRTSGAMPDYYHWAWSGSSEGTGLGWIDTSAAFTSWSPPEIGRIYRPEGVYEPEDPVIPGSHPSTFEIEATGVSSPALYRLECDLLRSNGTTATTGVDFGATAKYGETVYVPYTITAGDAASGGIQQNKLWYITACRLAGKLTATACAADPPAGPCGANAICDEAAGFCRGIAYVTVQKRPIFVHLNEWTKFGAGEDYYQAVKCWTGFPGEYLGNAKTCDFTGDASFALAMSKGMPIKRDCHWRGAVPDCGDRFCSGLSYLCPATPVRQPTRCQRGGSIIACDDAGYSPGDLCCSDQPVQEGSSFNHIVDGMECDPGDANDGYFDCDCASGDFGVGDCYSPGAQTGEYCCSADGYVQKL